ncbi:hypothetical protein PHMEG_00031891, partial [Phytophthora megakarya]
LFNSDDVDDPVEHALREVGSKQNGMYYVVNNTPLHFKLAVKHFSVELSFRQTATVICPHHDVTANLKLYDMHVNTVSLYARLLVSTSFQKIEKI